MKRMLTSTNAIRISLGAAICALLSVPVACSDDTTSPTNEKEAGTGGGDDGTGGKGGSAGKGGSGNGGSAGKATGGSAGSTGGTGTGGGGGKAGSAGAAGSAAGGTDGGTGVPDAEPPGTPEAGAGDGGPDAAPPNPCTDPAETRDANADNAKVCLTFAPETIAVDSANPQLDGKGVLLVQFYDTDSPVAGVTNALKTVQYPPPPATLGSANESVYSLPQIDVEGLPESVYMRVLFVDNQAFLAKPTTLTWGMFIGNLDLSLGVLPPPKLKKLTLTNDKGTLHPTTLTALRKIAVTSIELMSGVTPADDGQGPLSVGVFDVAAPSGQPVKGGVALPCTNITAAAVANAIPFTYGSGDRWVGAQLDDFNQGGTAKPGNIASLGGGGSGQSILDSQKVTFAADQYSATLAKVTLNFVIPGSTLGTAPFIHYACP